MEGWRIEYVLSTEYYKYYTMIEVWSVTVVVLTTYCCSIYIYSTIFYIL